MTGSYNPWLVCLSVLVAMAVSYMALNLTAQVARTQRRASLWLIGGAVVMGGGIWSMHFIGMLAFSLPIPLSYGVAKTLGSLAIAIGIAGFALAIASRPRITLEQIACSAVVMGLGICAMHYSGMSAIEIVPMIRYERTLFTASIVIAIGASFAALWLFVHLRERTRYVHITRIAAAIVMGLAISGMHYTGMAASRFAPGSYCIGAANSDNGWLALAIAVLALALIAITTVLLLYNAHLEMTRRHGEELEKANARLQHVATHDALTGLPNRLLLADRVDQAIAQADRHGTRFALVLVDVDRFKAVNDSLGHHAGDELLAEVALRLQSAVRKSDTLARFGGDEFVLLVNEITAVQEVELVIRSVLERVARPIELADLEVHITLSAGVSIYPSDGSDAGTLLKHADVAMYQVKRTGRNGFQFFAPAMNAFTRERLELEGGLRRALRAGEFELVYQPQVNASDGRIESAEALIRWNHPRRGVLPPAAFIPLAEETGLIIPIGEWVLREACRQAHAWQMSGLRPMHIAVNLSAQQLRQKNLPGIVRSALSDAGLQPGDLELELTESVVMQEAESSVQMLKRLEQLGISIAVDDFGTGYSSLSYLRRLPLRKLKIDHSFVRDLISGREAAEIVRAIVSLARSLELQVIAEGVETRAQLDALRRLGCDRFQGFHCSGPLPAAAFASLAADWDRRQLSAPRGTVTPLRVVSSDDRSIQDTDVGNL